MLSNPLHRFSAYNALPSSNMLSNGHLHMHSNGGLDPLSHNGQYALQQLQQHVDVHQNSQVHRNHNSKHRQHPYGPSNGRGVSGTSGPIRRRISRACDQCNQLRTKCDGQSPCAHCVGRISPCSNIWECGLMSDRIRPWLRVYSGEKEARQSFTKGFGTTSSSGSSKWKQITDGTIF